MFVVFNNTTKLITFIKSGIHTISEFTSFIDPLTTTNFNTDDNTTILNNSGNYFVDTGNIIRLRLHLELTADKLTIINDGRDKVTFTAKLKDTNNNLAQFIWKKRDSTVFTSLRDVIFVSSSVAYAVGDVGVILKSIDGGDTWTILNSTITDNILSVFFVSTTVGWVVGVSGLILNTVDGSSWTAQTSGTSEDLRSVFFVDVNTGWAVGTNGTILTTSDGGANWTAQTSGTSEDLNGVSFGSSSTGYVVGTAGTILKTVDGGANWVAQVSGTGNDLTSVTVTSPFNQVNIVYVCGAVGTILKTINGGTIWDTQVSTVVTLLNKISFGTLDNGWAVGVSGVILYTSTGGKTWLPQTSDTTNFLTSVSALTGSNLGLIVDAVENIYTTRRVEAIIAGTDITTEQGIVNFPITTTQFLSSLLFTIATTQTVDEETTVISDDFTIIASLTLTITVTVISGTPLLSPSDLKSISSSENPYVVKKTNFPSTSILNIKNPAVFDKFAYFPDNSTKKIYEHNVDTNVFTGKEYDFSPDTLQFNCFAGVSNDGVFLYIPLSNGTTKKFDRDLTTLSATIARGRDTIVFSSDGTRYFLINAGTSTISVIKTSDDSILKDIVDSTNIPSSSRVGAILFNDRLYIANHFTQRVSVFNTLSTTFEAPILASSDFRFRIGEATDGVSVIVTAHDNVNDISGFFVIDDGVLSDFKSLATGIDAQRVTFKSGRFWFADGFEPDDGIKPYIYVVSKDLSTQFTLPVFRPKFELEVNSTRIVAAPSVDKVIWAVQDIDVDPIIVQFVDSNINILGSPNIGNLSKTAFINGITTDVIKSISQELEIKGILPFGNARIFINPRGGLTISTTGTLAGVKLSLSSATDLDLAVTGGGLIRLIASLVTIQSHLSPPNSTYNQLFDLGAGGIRFRNLFIFQIFMNGDLTFQDQNKGPILLSRPGNIPYRLTVDDAGALGTEPA